MPRWHRTCTCTPARGATARGSHRLFRTSSPVNHSSNIDRDHCTPTGLMRNWFIATTKPSRGSRATPCTSPCTPRCNDLETAPGTASLPGMTTTAKVLGPTGHASLYMLATLEPVRRHLYSGNATASRHRDGSGPGAADATNPTALVVALIVTGECWVGNAVT